MTSGKFVLLAGVAVALCGAAVWVKGKRTVRTPDLVGRKVLPAFSVSDVARVEVDGAKKVALAASDKGWTVDALFGYPADAKKITDEILKLKDLKAGPSASEITNAATTKIVLKDAAGKELAALAMGDTHKAKAKGQMAMFGGGGYPDGRYVTLEGTTVLVNDSLDAFDGDPLKWVDRSICKVPSADVTSVVFKKGAETVKLARKDGKWDLEGLGAKEEIDTSKTYSLDSALSYLDLTGIADPKKSEADLGFTATGAVYTATLKNGTVYTARVGGSSGSDRWVKLSASFTATGTNTAENAKLEQAAKDFNAKVGAWTYSVSSYSADNMAKARKDLVKAKEEPKKDEKKEETKPAPAPAVKPAPAPAAKPAPAPAAKPAPAPAVKPAPAPAAKPAPAPAAKPAPAPAAKK